MVNIEICDLRRRIASSTSELKSIESDLSDLIDARNRASQTLSNFSWMNDGGFWRTIDGRDIAIRSMSDDYIRSALRVCLKRNTRPVSCAYLACEAQRRGMDVSSILGGGPTADDEGAHACAPADDDALGVQDLTHILPESSDGPVTNDTIVDDTPAEEEPSN